MRKLTIRKAFKASCELREAITSAINIIKLGTAYDVNERLGSMDVVIADLHGKVEAELKKNLNGVELAQEIRNRIQKANQQPLAYADGKSITDLIGDQATLKVLISWYPEPEGIVLMDKAGYEIKAENQREANALPQAYSRSNSFNVTGVPVEMRDKLVNDRMELRVALEEVTGKLAYANITETVDLTDEEVEVLRSFGVAI